MTGVSLVVSCVGVRLPDLPNVIQHVNRLAFYFSPVMYPLSLVPDRWRWVSALNPMTGIVESYRYAFLGAGTVEPTYLAISAVTTLVLLFSGIIVFSRTERTFIDTV